MLGKSQAARFGKRAVARLENEREDVRMLSASRRKLIYQTQQKLQTKAGGICYSEYAHGPADRIRSLKNLRICCESRSEFSRMSGCPANFWGKKV
jgi:hypothetical protein